MIINYDNIKHLNYWQNQLAPVSLNELSPWRGKNISTFFETSL